LTIKIVKKNAFNTNPTSTPSVVSTFDWSLFEISADWFNNETNCWIRFVFWKIDFSMK